MGNSCWAIVFVIIALTKFNVSNLLLKDFANLSVVLTFTLPSLITYLSTIFLLVVKPFASGPSGVNYGYPSLFTEQQLKAVHCLISCSFVSIKTRAKAILRFYLKYLDYEIKYSK